LVLAASFKIVTEKPRYKMDTFVDLRNKNNDHMISWFWSTAYENLPAITHVNISPKQLRLEACNTESIGYHFLLGSGSGVSNSAMKNTYAKEIAEIMKKYNAS
jgi:hypothetical protein